MILTDEEIAQLTKRRKPTAQCRALEALRIPYRSRPGHAPVVLRSAVEAILGGQPTPTPSRPQVKLTR